MKTVIDAVNEFKGKGYDFSADWIERSNNKHCYIEVTAIAPNRREIRNIGQIVNAGTRFNRKYSRLVCTKDEFLETVAECETNFGKCNQSYSDYKFIKNLFYLTFPIDRVIPDGFNYFCTVKEFMDFVPPARQLAIADLIKVLEAGSLGEDYEIDASAIYDAGYRKK